MAESPGETRTRPPRSTLLRGLLWQEEDGVYSGSPLRNLPYATVAIPLFFVHLALAQLGWLLLFGSALTPVWPSAGVDLVALLVFGPRFWPVLFAAYLTSIHGHTSTWVAAIGIAVANSWLPLTGVWLFNTISKGKALGRFKEVAAITGTALLSPLVPAAAGSAILILNHTVPASQWQSLSMQWWISDALGVLILAPVLLGIGKCVAGLNPPCERKVIIKTVLLAAAVAAGCYFVFYRPEPSYLLFLVLALILFSAAWAGPLAAQVSALVIAAAAVWAAHIGVGTFAGGTVRENLQNLNLFLAAVSLTGLAVGAFRAYGSLVVPGGVLLAGWALSGWLYASLDRDRIRYDDVRFERVMTAVETQLRSRLATYENALRGASGFLAASDHPNPQAWHSYIDRFGFLDRYPGTFAIEFIRPVTPAQLDSFVATQQREGSRGFRLRSLPGRRAPLAGAEYFIATYVEPPQTAAILLGSDVASDADRKAAAERARDTGLATMASVLMTMSRGPTPGLMLFVPVYREGASAAPHQGAFIGWTAVAFTAETFFRAALANLGDQVALRVYDAGVSPDHPIFVSDRSQVNRPFERATKLELAGSAWTLAWNRTPEFPYMSKTPSAWAAGCTALLSLLLAGLVVNLQSTGQRASALAEERTRDLAKALHAADAANRAKSEFLANMSHEIRTPMNGVLGMLSLLRDSEMDDEQKEFADTAHSSAESLLRVLNDVLDFSKIEAGRIGIETRPFDLGTVVTNVIDLLKPQAAEKTIELALRWSPLNPRTLVGDEGRLRQVLLNLAGNAVKFTSQGKVTLGVDCTQIEDGKARMRFEVEDTGIGIAEDVQQQLFQKFTQADASITRRFGGTGLGLAISKELVQLMGGDLSVTSHPGQGSTFWFELWLPLVESIPAGGADHAVLTAS